jgi:exodeoxyribonuclease VII large subunit
MAKKPAKSQWDFGELFAPEAIRQVVTVSELTLKIKRLLEGQFCKLWVSGEITNLRLQSSGHMYFTLKDAGAQLSCVLFRGEPVAERAAIRDGAKVLLQGDVSVYEPRGQYQLVVHQVELQGVGALQAAFERLKLRLAGEGLFASERKRPLPRLPRRIGVVTSPTGAALRDVCHVIRRRYPGLEIILAPVRVQGEGAAAEIAAGVQLLNRWSQSRPERALDAILVTRGGGSLEDLWAFNEEVVARAIFDSALPVVSAVGHEIDFTISDFVADLRAATPSAAAELLTEGAVAARRVVEEAGRRLPLLAARRWEAERLSAHQLQRRFALVHPRRRMNERMQFLDDLQERLIRNLTVAHRERHLRARTLVERFARLRLRQEVALRQDGLRQLQQRLREQAGLLRQRHSVRFDQARLRLQLLAPENVLRRGYSITMDAVSGAVVRAAGQVQPGQKLRTRLAVGEIESSVERGSV